MGVAVHNIVQAVLAHLAILGAELIAAIKLSVIDFLLCIFALAVDELSTVCSRTRLSQIEQPVSYFTGGRYTRKE